MWARVVEICLGIWLTISWLIFGYDVPTLLMHDFIVAFFLCTFSLLSYLAKFQMIHLANFLIGIWLIIFAYMIQGSLIIGADQNYMVLGILFLMLSIIPSHAKYPPKRWIQYMHSKKK